LTNAKWECIFGQIEKAMPNTLFRVRFFNPKTGTANPFSDFQPGNYAHYPKGIPGVYIFGFRAKIDGKTVFIPLYVGIAKDLGKRLWQHYTEERSGGNSKWYVFDYAGVRTIGDVTNLYADMTGADAYTGIDSLRYTPRLIWFNHPTFFNQKLTLHGASHYTPNSGVLNSILDGGDLDQIHAAHPGSIARELKNSIIRSKAVFDDSFYFVYCPLNSDGVSVGKQQDELAQLFANCNEGANYMNGRRNGPGRTLAERIEHATKKLFQKEINIYTVAKSHGVFCKMEIDLSDIASNLVKVDTPIIENTGTYQKPLILK
jgi:hypothetical protein